MRTDYIDQAELEHLLAALMPANRLALEISLATGLRISDVLNLRTDEVRNAKEGRLSIREMKTGKRRRFRLPAELQRRALALAGKVFIFENRLDWRRHRTRQAVYKDLRRAAELFRLSSHLTIAPHSARKVWAVGQRRKHGLGRVQQLLNHSSEAVTMLYAMADELTARKYSK